MHDTIQWVAYYGDEIFPQYNEDGSENKYAEIDRKRLTHFAIAKGGVLLFRFHFEEGMRLVYRRRVEIKPGVGETIMYLAGWQKTENGVNSQAIACVFAHGGPVEIISKWSSGWFDAPDMSVEDAIEGTDTQPGEGRDPL